MDWLVRVVYGTTTLDFELPQGHWTPMSVAVGGRDISATGIPAAYEVRRDELLTMRLRVLETEWEDVHAWLIWGQRFGSFTVYPDRSNLSASHTVYLHEPAMGEEIRPERDESFPLMYWQEVVVRRVGFGEPPFSDVYHPGT